MTRTFAEGTIQWAFDVLGPIRAAARKKRSWYDQRPYWLDGKPASRNEVVAEARKRAKNTAQV